MVVIVALLSGALFIPSTAIFLGTVSNSKKLFEVTFLTVWYMGTIEHLAPLDFLGTTSEALVTGMPLVFFLLGVGFLVAAFITRRRQLAL